MKARLSAMFSLLLAVYLLFVALSIGLIIVGVLEAL
jgi:hypothetical protein